MKTLLCITVIFYLLSISNSIAFAHPGRTASDGCHYCRTNCDEWGVAWNQRHCHGGTPAPVAVAPQASPKSSAKDKDKTPPGKEVTAPVCPINSFYDEQSKSCKCDPDHCPHQGACMHLPENAHCTQSSTNPWDCKVNYEKVGDSCEAVTLSDESDEVVEEELSLVEGTSSVISVEDSPKGSVNFPFGLIVLGLLGVFGYRWYRGKSKVS